MNCDISWYVYKPSEWQKANGFSVDEERCRFRVHADFGVGFRQCVRKAKHTVEGYGFCTQHAKIVEEGLK